MIRIFFLIILLLPALCTSKEAGVSVIIDSKKSTHSEFIRKYTSVIESAPDILTSVIDIANGISEEQLKSIASSDIVITVGSQNAYLIQEVSENTALINAMLPAAIFYNLLETQKKSLSRYAVFVDPDPYIQLSYIKKRFGPEAKIGILTGPSSRRLSDRFKLVKKELGVNLSFMSAQTRDAATIAIKDLTSTADVILAVYDPVVMNSMTAKWMLYSTFNAQKPLVGYSRSYLSAGAAAAIYTTPELIGASTAKLLFEIVKNRQLKTKHIFITDTVTEENKTILNRLGFVGDGNEN